MTNPLIQARDAFATKHPELRILLNGRDWGYRDVGSGAVLLMIPGTLGRGDIFWNQIEALSDRLRIVTVSYPSSGGIAEWAADIQGLMDHLNIPAAAILGSSLGGYLAQYIAGAAPDRVTRLLAANTLHSAVGLDQRPPYSLDLQAAPIEELRAGFGAGLSAWGQAHPDQADLVELLLAEAGGRILEPELRARLDALKQAPALPPVPHTADQIVTIEADDDPLIPAEMRLAVRAQLNPGIAYRFLSGGHFPYVARPADYTALLEQTFGLTGTGPDWGTEKERCR
ncbi:alpha/beta fold hydrolase [Shimia sediminis]|uniref:alpha/beta fold hydrolase n=1 Tax=Shimia sediminis TaxID=2497945 RepID=UPI000F8F1FDC|nr:alpha/beta hydrolase [Shimia sediminis]